MMVMTTDFGNRLRQARKHANLTQAQLGKLTGVSQSTIASTENEGNSSTNTSQFARATNVNANWLATGEGEMLSQHGSVAIHAAQEHRPSYWPAETALTINQFDTGGSMGSGLVLPDQPGVIQSMKVSPEWVQKNLHNITSVRNLAIVTGFGDSMKPLYNPGDPLLVDQGITEVKYEAIYFFRVGEEGFVKRLQRIPGQGLLVISDNPKYRDWTITEDMDFQVFARVVKVWRGEDF